MYTRDPIRDWISFHPDYTTQTYPVKQNIPAVCQAAHVGIWRYGGLLIRPGSAIHHHSSELADE